MARKKNTLDKKGKTNKKIEKEKQKAQIIDRVLDRTQKFHSEYYDLLTEDEKKKLKEG